MIKIEKDGQKIKVTLDNGHADALRKIVSDYGIVDEEKAVGFILSVMRDANGSTVRTGSGSFVPSEKIKKPLQNATQDANPAQ